MPSKYPVLKPKAIIYILQKINYYFVSQKGSHLKYSDGKHIVIIPNHDEVAKGTLKSILKQANISLDDFLKLLNDKDYIMGNKSKVLAVCISEKKGVVKHAVDFVEVNEKGIVGDAHSGDWHRQISFLSVDSVNKMQSKINFELKPGAFAENVLIDTGIVLFELQIGQKMKVGECTLEVTQIGKECHATCEIRMITGDCVMPREGIFTKVITGGKIKPGDEVELL